MKSIVNLLTKCVLLITKRNINKLFLLLFVKGSGIFVHIKNM